MATQLPQGVRLLRTLTSHNGPVGRIGWSGDGLLLATLSTDRTARIWEADSGECLRILQCGQGAQLAVAFDMYGRILATGGDEGTMLWDVDSGELRTRLDIYRCYAVALSSVNCILATATQPWGVQLWDPDTDSCLYRLTGHEDYVLDVAFDVSGRMLATGSQDCTIILWDVSSGQRLRTFAGHSNSVVAVAFHPYEGILASASLDCTVRLWDVASGSVVSILEGHTEGLRYLSFSHDGRLLASASDDGTIRIWETRSGRCLLDILGLTSDEWRSSVAFHPWLPILAVVGSVRPSYWSDGVMQRGWGGGLHTASSSSIPRRTVSSSAARRALQYRSGRCQA